MAFNQGCKGLVPAAQLEVRYLQYWLWVNRPSLQSRGTGSTFMELGNEGLLAFEIPLRPKVEQRRIADFLDDQIARVDRVIAARRRQVGCVDENRAAAIQDLFDGLDGEAVALSWVLRAGVQDGPHETPVFLDEGVPFLSVDSIVQDKIRFEGTRFVSLEAHREFSRKCRPRRGDVLLTKAASVGKVAVVDTDIEFNVWSPIAVLRPRPGVLRSDYLAWALRSPEAQTQMALASTNSTQNNLAMRDIASLRIQLPTLEEQDQLVARLATVEADVDSARRVLMSSVDLFQEFKRSLISAAVSGEFDVSTADGSGVRV